jgi:hypothetical protein
MKGNFTKRTICKKVHTVSSFDILFESFSLSNIVDLINEFFVKLCNDGANLYFFIQTSQRQSPR